MTKPKREKAISELITKHEAMQNDKTILCIADLGCASGPNTLEVVSELIITSEMIRRQRGGEPNRWEYQIYLNDLPGNDFNSVFQSLPKFNQELKEKASLKTDQFFVVAVPGSFYGRLFPHQSLHFVHSSYSLYWLSQVPKGLDNNKHNIYMSNTSPECVVKAYKKQFQEDTQLFLKSRSMELIKGGKMVLTYWGRSSEDPIDTDSCFAYNSMAHALSELVSQGIVEEEKLEAFNVPVYHASATEVIEEVQKEGSFYMNDIGVTQVNINGQDNKNGMNGVPTNLLFSIYGSILISHFGEMITNEVFRRISPIIEDGANSNNVSLTNVTVSLTKK